MIVGTCVLDLYLPGVQSLKEKRGILKSLLGQLKKKFNVSVAEVEFHDVWQSANLGIAVVSTNKGHAENMLENITAWIERYRPDIDIIEQRVETIRVV